MKKLAVLLVLCMLICTLAGTASAATGANKITSFITVAPDGSCQVTTTVTLHLEQAAGSLAFPVPAQAYNVTLNGSRVRTQYYADAQQVDLSGILGSIVGDVSFTINYAMSDLVSYNEQGVLQLNLPLLSGFAYPVELYELSLTLPGSITGQPSFSSGYYQTSIEEILSYSVNGATLTCYSTAQLKDHETMSLTLRVDEETFVSITIPIPRTPADDIALAVFAVLAILYYLIFLRCPIPQIRKRANAPDSYSAGQLKSILNLQGADLSLMILSWAQLGYVLIHDNGKGQVTVYKRMEMGNERSNFEQKVFAKLFSRKNEVQTWSLFYANLVQSVAASRYDAAQMLKRNSGNPLILRVLGCLAGAASGVAIGIVLGTGTALQGFWIVVYGILGALVVWGLCGWGATLLVRNRTGGWIATVLGILWIGLGFLAQEWILAVAAVGTGLLCSLLLAFGGRRNESGVERMETVLGLRSYLKKFTAEQAQQACSLDPEYFFTMAPWALALAVNRKFARRFGNQKLEMCPYVMLDKEVSLSAKQWSKRLHQTLSDMDRRARQMPVERIRRAINGFRGK